MTLTVDISKKYNGFTLRIAFETDGSRLGILGASGSGKSLTLKMIAGIEHPDSGIIRLNGRTLFDSKNKINVSPQHRRVGYLFQQYALFPNMTVTQNIGCGLGNIQKNQRAEIVGDLLDRFRLSHLADRYPHQLSGGQQQRVALARCLASDPELILLDEPFSALDAHLREQLSMEMKTYLDRYHGESILVTHSRDEVYAMCPQLLVIDGGTALSMGGTEEQFSNPKIMRVAQLTGCKNISPVTVVDHQTLLATDWKLRLNVPGPIPESVTHVGVRAHDLTPADEGEKTGNLFPCSLHGIQQGLFETTVLLHPYNDGKQPLWWKTDKNSWKEKYQANPPTHFMVRPESLMLLKDNQIIDLEDERFHETDQNS